MIGFTMFTLFLVGQSNGRLCEEGETNYTSTLFTEESQEVYIMEYKWEQYKTCRFLIFGCEKKSRIRKNVIKKTICVHKPYQVVSCCPGYINASDVCTEGCEKRMFGENCTQNCSSCLSFCDKETGACICDPGYTGDNCTQECSAGFYGENCEHICRCENNSTCNPIDGTCNCTSPGWEGALCDLECTNNTYGLFCNEKCACNTNQTCNHVDGSCICKSGWQGENCSKECDAMKFGVDCRENCTCDRNNTLTCDKETGTCQCKPGYTDIDCVRKCPMGTFGEKCIQNCSDNCMHTEYCDHINGTCICLGKRGPNCSEECEPGGYGPDCSMFCNCSQHSLNQSCDNIYGQCDCNSGWTGRSCDKECDSGKYGANCTMYCNCTNSIGQSCDNITGQCDCMSGWTGRMCDKEFNSSFSDMKYVAELEGFIEQNMLYLLIGILVFFILTTLTVTVVCIRRRNMCNSMFSRGAKRASVTSNSLENPGYTASSKDAIHISNITTINTQNIYEEADIETEADNSSSDKADIVSNGKCCDKLAVDGSSALDKVSKNLEDEYSVPDKDTHIHNEIHLNDVRNSQELYNCTKDNGIINKDAPNEYNTFQDVKKIQEETKELSKESDSEDDYDVITHVGHTGSKKKNIKDLEHYSSFEQVRKLSLKETVDEEEDTYNSLNDHELEHKSAHINNSQYHHISLKDKTIDGEKMDKTKPRNTSERESKTSNKFSKQISIPEKDIISEDSEEESANNKGKLKDENIEEEELTEVIYDECDIDDNDNEEDKEKTEDRINTASLSVNNNTSINEVVYEECDENDNEQASAVLYEDVDSVSQKSDSNEDEKEEEDMQGKQEEKPDQYKPLIKRTKDRRREDYEEFSL